jgi:Asp-tRNA(Asn)/Glu-tRNA(Gln) amidotransferase A subunit family amidase
VPVSIKDVLWTKGLRTTGGSLVHRDDVPDEDSVAAERVRDAGAVIIGKTNTPEFAMFRRTLNRVVPECLNPWDVTRTSGGSSGGSAVAVAAGMGPLSIGTDGGGSIRIPAAWNGILGVHPSRGRVPRYGGFGDSPGRGIGPMCRDVRDAALVLDVLSGPDQRQPGCLAEATAFVRDLTERVVGLRMAWTPDLGHLEPSDARVVQVCRDAALAFEELGAVVEEPGLRFFDPWDLFARDADPDLSPPSGGEGPLGAYAELLQDPASRALLSPYVGQRDDRPTQLEYSLSIPPAVRSAQHDTIRRTFERFDVVRSPVIDHIAPVCHEARLVPWTYTAYTLIANKAGHPAASFPCGVVDGMPVGLQLMGRRGEEQTLLNACRALELARPFAHLHPALGHTPPATDIDH